MASDPSKFIPNSFQTPNAYVDELMAFLTAEEWKVLSYAVRKIFGFQKRQDRISKSQFMIGSKDENGEWYDHGTGLGDTAVSRALDSLVAFGILLILAENDIHKNEGKLYGLQLNEALIDTEALHKRMEDQQAADKARMERARSARKSDGFHEITPTLSQQDHPLADKGRVALADKPTVPLADKVNNNQENHRKPGRSRKRDAADPRSSHPAIQLVKFITGRFPNKKNYDEVIANLGSEPDREKAERIYGVWTFGGRNPIGLGWTDWYRNGIPDRVTKPKQSSSGKGQTVVQPAPIQPDEDGGFYA
jgi:hypothetical protein